MRVFVVDDVGLLQRVTLDYAQAALDRGEVELTDTVGVVRVIPQPIRELTPEEKHQIWLKKQQQRNRRARR